VFPDRRTESQALFHYSEARHRPWAAVVRKSSCPRLEIEVSQPAQRRHLPHQATSNSPFKVFRLNEALQIVRPTCLTAERLTHILEHPEMTGMELEICGAAPANSWCAARSPMRRSGVLDFTHKTVLGGRCWCVVKYGVNDAFVVTAYLPTNQKPRRAMAEKVKVWFDAEADYLEVPIRRAAGYLRRQTRRGYGACGAQGNIVGFSILESAVHQDKPWTQN